jgi:hypothetical protein
MTHLVALFLALFVVITVVPGCNDGESAAEKSAGAAYEAAARRHVKAVRETLDAVNGVKNEADAAAAVGKLEGAQKEFEAIAVELKRQPKMTAAQKKAVEAIFREAGGGGRESTTLRPPKDEWAFRQLAPQLQKTRRAMAAAQARWAEQEAGGN